MNTYVPSDETGFRLLTTSELNTLYKSLVLLRHFIQETNHADEPPTFIDETIGFVHHLIYQELLNKEHQELIGN